MPGERIPVGAHDIEAENRAVEVYEKALTIQLDGVEKRFNKIIEGLLLEESTVKKAREVTRSVFKEIFGTGWDVKEMTQDAERRFPDVSPEVVRDHIADGLTEVVTHQGSITLERTLARDGLVAGDQASVMAISFEQREEEKNYYAATFKAGFSARERYEAGSF